MCFVGGGFHADCVEPEPLAHSHNSALNQIITADVFFFFFSLVSFEIHPLASSHVRRVARLFFSPVPGLRCSSRHRRKRCLDKFKEVKYMRDTRVLCQTQESAHPFILFVAALYCTYTYGAILSFRAGCVSALS